MRVEKQKIVNGIVSYIDNEVVPKIANDKATQIIISVGANTLRGNPAVVDKVFNNGIVSAVIKHEVVDDKDTYELDGLFSLVKDSVAKYGYFPITLPAIPFVSPTEKELKFSSEDIEMLKTYIEEAK